MSNKHEAVEASNQPHENQTTHSNAGELRRLVKSTFVATVLPAVFLITAQSLPGSAATRQSNPANANRNPALTHSGADASLSEPALRTWNVTGSLKTARYYCTATLLPNGTVLVAGGTGGSTALKSAELYDPVLGTWTPTSNLHNPRFERTATLLPNGMVLVAGGEYKNGQSVASAELYDPSRGTWTLTGSLDTARQGHTAILLPDGKVLVAGGFGFVGGDFASAELYDPATGIWTVTGSLNATRTNHTATLLKNGKVLVAGGMFVNYLASAELYDPASGSWTTTGSLNTARELQTATLRPNGMVLVAAGCNSRPLASAELYDPASGTWNVTDSLSDARDYHTATLLPNGTVLVAGGRNNVFAFLKSAELYDPASGTWSATGSLTTGRAFHVASLLSNGTVLVAGGSGGNGALTSAELYDSGLATVSLISAASRLTHGAAGTFDIDMPLTGISGVEDRSSGTYNAFFTFDGPVTSADVTVTAGTVTVGNPAFSGNTISVPLIGVADAQIVTLHVANVNGSGLPTGDVNFGFLIGDANGNRKVDKPDQQQIQTDKGQPVTGSNFRDDINLSGVVDKPDLQLVSANKNHSIP